MKTLTSILFTSLLLAISAGYVRAQDPQTCEDFRCQFQARLQADCACDTAVNHGQYVSCVAHIVNDLVAEGLPTNCKGKLTRCAARSVCGKQSRGFATCTTFTYGTCVANDGLPSTCDTDPTIECSADTDCVASTQCRLTRNVAGCELAGGAVNLAPTCCSSCVTPP